MQTRLFMSLVVLCGLVLPLQAQDNPQPAESASVPMISDALEGLSILFAREGNDFSFKLGGHSVSLHRLDNGGRLLLKAPVAKQSSLETINLYNERIAVTTRAVRYQKEGLILEAGLDCSLG